MSRCVAQVALLAFLLVTSASDFAHAQDDATKAYQVCQHNVMSQLNAVPEGNFVSPKTLAMINSTRPYVSCLKDIISKQSRILFDEEHQKKFMKEVERLDHDSRAVYSLLWEENRYCPGTCGMWDTEKAQTNAASSMEALLQSVIQVEHKQKLK